MDELSRFLIRKIGCAFQMVISPEFLMEQYRDDDHREDALHCINFVAHFINEYPRIFAIRCMVTIHVSYSLVSEKRFFISDKLFYNW